MHGQEILVVPPAGPEGFSRKQRLRCFQCLGEGGLLAWSLRRPRSSQRLHRLSERMDAPSADAQVRDHGGGVFFGFNVSQTVVISPEKKADITSCYRSGNPPRTSIPALVHRDR